MPNFYQQAIFGKTHTLLSFWHKLYQQAETDFYKKNYPEALKNFQYLLEYYPHHYQVDELLLKCGLSAAAHGDNHKAIYYFRHSFKIRPTPQKARYLELFKSGNSSFKICYSKYCLCITKCTSNIFLVIAEGGIFKTNFYSPWEACGNKQNKQNRLCPTGLLATY